MGKYGGQWDIHQKVLMLQPRASPRQGVPSLLIFFLSLLDDRAFYGQALGSLSHWSSLGQRSHLLPAHLVRPVKSLPRHSLISLLNLVMCPTPSTKAWGPPNDKAVPQQALPKLRWLLPVQVLPWLPSFLQATCLHQSPRDLRGINVPGGTGELGRVQCNPGFQSPYRLQTL